MTDVKDRTVWVITVHWVYEGLKYLDWTDRWG